MTIRSVVFDVGETLMDDSTFWGSWADWLGVPRHTLATLVGSVTAMGQDNAEALRLIRPGFDLVAERQAREEAGQGECISEADLYPDVRPALTALRNAGLWVGIAGNQTSRAAELLAALDLPVDGIATSGQWGVAKPDPAFFSRVVDWAPGEPDEIVYVGDHRDNDIVPAKANGLRALHIRRGPWGYLWAEDPDLKRSCDWQVDSLTEIVELVR
ncbi:HAD family hydrolase [Kitasatospora sp. CMC57]|uniref:HAD family hydrolase n=1 Tax=Kitasatospora sp. CMC57 TaxID=3231513 RepID=A0AB33JXE1_9ACTN